MNYINKKTVGGGFLAILLLLIFFSKTIYTFRLPEVTGALPQNGKLSKLEIASGIAAWADTESLYAAVGGTVDEVLVKEGDRVTAGQELLRLRFDADEAERGLRELQNSRVKLSLELESINLNIAETQRYIKELEDKDYEAEDLLTSELAVLAVLAVDIRKAQAALRDLRERYDDGDEVNEVTDLELETARYDLQRLYVQQETLIKQQEQDEEKAEKDLKEKEDERASKLLDYKADLVSLQLDLKAKTWSWLRTPSRRSLTGNR